MSTKKIQIIDSLVKQAENANTLGGKSAEEFALTSDIEQLQSQIGDQPVADQIESALAAQELEQSTTRWHRVSASCANYADLDSVLQNLDSLAVYSTIIDLTITSGGELNTDLTAKNGKDTYGDFLGVPYLYTKTDRSYYGVKLICLEDNSLWDYVDHSYDTILTKLSNDITHSWDGTTLNITSASGTSSADLKGPKGDKGDKGDTGAIGPIGVPGYSPVKGTDYWTEEDKAEINAENIEFMTTELAKRGQLKPEFANSISDCTDTSKLYVLPDGYIYGYMVTELVTDGYDNKAQPLPNNTTDTALWVNGYRIGSGGTPSAQGNTTLSNCIACAVGDVVRVKGVTFRDSNDRYALYKADNSTNGATYVSQPNNSYATVNIVDDVYEFTIVKADTAYIRFVFETPTDVNSVIITVNEEIVEPTITTDYTWKNTNHAFVPNDYDEEFANMDSRVLDLKKSVTELIIANQELSNDLDNLNYEVENIGKIALPSYWESHLDERIERIKELQKKGGKDTFTFPMFADTHYTSNLSKISPLLAKMIMDKVHSKFAVDVGDAQTRGCHASKEALEEENVLIDKMFEPIRDRLLRTEGNHDGSYGKLDRDGDGVISNHYSNGTVKPYNERETYVHNLTQAELYECIYRENGLVGDVHTDSSGTAFYVDDTASKARFIVLNTHKNDYDLNTDGTQKYPKMWLFHYTQEQFDFLINEALTKDLSDEWVVMVFAHCPVTQEIEDRELMQGVLNAFKNKTSYKGDYEGNFSYDSVSVDVDFSNAKGEFVGYFHGHNHVDSVDTSCGFNVIGTRCDAKEENDSTLKSQRVQGTVTEQSFDVFTVNKAERKIYATKIGAGNDRIISF